MVIKGDTAYFIEDNDSFGKLKDEGKIDEAFIYGSIGSTIKILNLKSLTFQGVYNTEPRDGEACIIYDTIALDKGILIYEVNGMYLNILYVDKNNNVNTLKDGIVMSTDMVPIATKRDNIYYNNSEKHEIISMNIYTDDDNTIWNYQNYDVETVLGMTSKNIYYLDANNILCQYNIQTQSVNKELF